MADRGVRQSLLVARRELRHGKATFALSVITTMLATTMLSAVLGLGDSLRQTLTTDARTILGGNYELRLNTRDFTADELAWLTARADRTSKVTFIRAAGFTDEVTSLLQVRVVDDNYPLFGKLGLGGGMEYDPSLLQRRVDGGVAGIVTNDLAGALGIGVGGRFELGAAQVEVVALVERVPDPNATMMLNAPVVYLARSALAATGLDQPGVLRSERLRLDIGARDAVTWREELYAVYPDDVHDWRVRGTDRVVPSLQETIGRMETMMLLVSLGTMLIAGICVGNSASTYLRSRINSIAILRSLGMSPAHIRLAYWLVAMTFVLVGALLGMPLGFLGQFMIIEFLSGQLPFEINLAFSLTNTLVIPAVALLVAWVFAERPLQVFSHTNPTTLFSLSSGVAHAAERLPAKAWRWVAVPLALLAGVLLLSSADNLFLLLFGLGGAVATLGFRMLANGVLRMLRHLRPSTATTRIALRSAIRNGPQVSAASVSLGVGLAALLTFSLTEANFRNQLSANLSTKSPDYYLIGLQPGDVEPLRAATAEWLPRPGNFRTLPTIRGRVTHLQGVPVEEIEAPESVDWVVEGDRWLTWAHDPANEWTGASRISAGEPWQPGTTHMVSFDAESADAFTLSIGSVVGVRILGQDYDVTIANLRRIDWTTFDVNFAMVLSDGPWTTEPHAFLGSARDLVGDHFAYQRKVVEVAPSVTPVRTKTIVESVTGMLRKISLLLSIVTLTATISGVLVLAAAIAEGRQRRAHESVVLRILGTSHAMLSSVFRTEFLVIAGLAALPALGVAVAASYSITRFILTIPWQLDWTTALIVMGATLATVLGLGTLSTRRLVRTPPLRLLHNS